MPITKQLSSLTNAKQLTGADSPQNPGSLVTYTYGPATSTAGQTVINLGFSVSTTNTGNFFLWIDGKLMSLGSSNDYTFTSIQSNGTSSQVTMNNTLAANLNINASYLGVLIPNAASTSILTINSEIAALQPVYSLKTANYTLISSDRIVQFNCSSGSLVATLPSAATVTVGQPYEICRAADATIANTLTINTTSSQTISTRASGSIILSPNDYLVVVSDGSNWQIVEVQESVSARYTFVSNAGIPNNTVEALTSSFATYTKIRDTHGAFNTATGVYTIVVPGTYRFTLRTTFVPNTANTGTIESIITTSSASTTGYTPFGIASNTTNVNVDSAPLQVGSTISFSILQSSGGTESFTGTGNANSISIERIGN